MTVVTTVMTFVSEEIRNLISFCFSTYPTSDVELSFGFRARDYSSLPFAIMMFNKGCIYIKLYFFTKLVYRLTKISNNK